MALIFPWATKEYLLWEMTIGQIIMYHNKAMDIKNGKKPASVLASKSADELRSMRDQIMNDAAAAEKELMRQKYGAIDG